MVADVNEHEVRSGSKHRGRILLNLPPELADRLRALAREERRPLTHQIQLMLERLLETWKAAV